MTRNEEVALSWRLSQAVDLVRVQVKCTREEALALLTERAAMRGSDPSTMAEALVSRRISFRSYA